ncbi:MAG: dihydroorotase [Rhizobiales bacterium]|nr:dihydroorotase [Hyphomicrobiales bacterium]
MNFDLVIKNGEVVNQDGKGQTDIGIKDGKIVSLGDLSQASAGQTISVTGLTVLPGVVDSQVHFREPGNEHKEDLDTGSRAAVMGGVTSVFEMPNTSPLTTCPETLADKIKRARHRMFCDFAFYVGGTRENTNDIPDLERLEGSAGIKVFIGSSTGNLLVDDEESLKKILAKITRRAAFHSEDEARLIERKDVRRHDDPSSHPEWRDVTAAMISTKMLVEAAREAGKRIHVLHISTAEEIEYLAHHKDVASVELTPQHLSLSAPEVYEKLGTYAQMNPPLREARHAKALWLGLQNGVADVLGSDHAPHTIEEKEKPYPESPSGMTGVQTLVPIMLDHVNNGKLSLERFVDLTSHGPNRLFGMATKGRIAVGMDADLTIVDMNQTKTITNDWIESKSQWTPYNGQTVKGWPKGTIIRGHRVMWEDEIIGTAIGEPVKFSEAL